MYRYCFVLLCIWRQFPGTSPRGAYIWRGDLTEGFLRYEFGRLIFGILRYTIQLISHTRINEIETLTLRFFGISRETWTSRSHVTRALPSSLRFKVHVCTARPRSRGKWFTVRFFAPSHVWEEIRLLWLSNSISKHIILKTISQLKWK